MEDRTYEPGYHLPAKVLVFGHHFDFQVELKKAGLIASGSLAGPITFTVAELVGWVDPYKKRSQTPGPTAILGVIFSIKAGLRLLDHGPAELKFDYKFEERHLEGTAQFFGNLLSIPSPSIRLICKNKGLTFD